MKKMKSLIMLSFVTLALVSCGTKKENKMPDPTPTPDPVNPVDDVEIVGDFIPEVKSHDETVVLTWEDNSLDNVKVEYKKNNETNWELVDKELIRQENANKNRVDILGLDSAYEYDVKITDSNKKTVTVSKIDVYAQDRSGYAHFKNTEGVGAYTNDGVLKEGAIVVYVNNDNKNTVSTTINGNVVTGLSNIIKSVGTNNVLDIRILDEIQTQQWNYKAHGAGKTQNRLDNMNNLFSDVNWEVAAENEAKISGIDYASSGSYRLCEEDIIKGGYNSMSNDIARGITHLDGLTNNVLKDKSNGEYDSYYNELDVKNCNNITIEGVGDNAGIYQWGFCFNKCNSIEVKNLHFSGYTEDAIGIQGANNSNIDYHNYWIHNNTFDSGLNNWDVSYENDKTDGDGSTDFKYAHNLTISYCRYNNCHKTALIGPNSSSLQYNITFHHNFYNTCGSRLPFTRQSNIHAYNNYYYKSTGTNTQINDKAYFVVENSVFEDANKAFTTSGGGVVKSYNNLFSGKSTSANSTVVSARAKTVNNTCMADGETNMSNFDTNEELFYYDKEHQCSSVMYMHDVDKVADAVKNLSGSGLHESLELTKSSVYYGDGNLIEITPVEDAKEATKTDGIPNSAGVYYKVGTKFDSSEASLTSSASDKVEYYDNGQITITDISADYTTWAFYMFDNVYSSGTHTYKVNIELTGIGTKWSMVNFIDGASNLAVRSGGGYVSGQSNGNDGKYSYSIDASSEVVISDTKWTANTSYEITLVMNYDTNTATLSIGNSSITINNYTTSGITGIYFMTAKSANNRSFTVKSITVE